MSWKKRAQRVVKTQGSQLAQTTVHEIEREGSTSAEDLVFLLQSNGAPIQGQLSYDREGLVQAEAAYRLVAKDTSISLPERDQLERLLGIFLGQVLIELKGGSWRFYRGRYSPINPVVVQMASGKHVDVLGFAEGLAEDRQVVGFSSQDSLARFLNSAELDAFP